MVWWLYLKVVGIPQPKEHDYIKILQILQVTHASIAYREEHQIQMAEGPGSMLTLVTFVAAVFVFA